MPEISRFMGIKIFMYQSEKHQPHFHAEYAEFSGLIEIESRQQIEGDLPVRILRVLTEWAVQHEAELIENWKLMRRDDVPNKIDPYRR